MRSGHAIRRALKILFWIGGCALLTFHIHRAYFLNDAVWLSRAGGLLAVLTSVAAVYCLVLDGFDSRIEERFAENARDLEQQYGGHPVPAEVLNQVRSRFEAAKFTRSLWLIAWGGVANFIQGYNDGALATLKAIGDAMRNIS